MNLRRQIIRFAVAPAAAALFLALGGVASADTNSNNGYTNYDGSGQYMNPNYNYFNGGYSGFTNYNSNYGNNSDTNSMSFRADMSNTKEVPPASQTVTGTTRVVFADNNSAQFTLIVNGNNIIDAHLHCAMPGQNGPVVVPLFHTTNSGGVNVNGLLSSGTIENSSLATTSTQCSGTIGYSINNMADLMRALREGKIYSNAHSVQFPMGVSRGQMAPEGGFTQGGQTQGDNHNYGNYGGGGGSNYDNNQDHNNYQNNCDMMMHSWDGNNSNWNSTSNWSGSNSSGWSNDNNWNSNNNCDNHQKHYNNNYSHDQNKCDMSMNDHSGNWNNSNSWSNSSDWNNQNCDNNNYQNNYDTKSWDGNTSNWSGNSDSNNQNCDTSKNQDYSNNNWSDRKDNNSDWQNNKDQGNNDWQSNNSDRHNSDWNNNDNSNSNWNSDNNWSDDSNPSDDSGD